MSLRQQRKAARSNKKDKKGYSMSMSRRVRRAAFRLASQTEGVRLGRHNCRDPKIPVELAFKMPGAFHPHA